MLYQYMILTALILSSSLYALEVVPNQDGEHVSVELKHLKLPRKLNKELSSGLTTRMLFQLSLQQGGDVLSAKTYRLSVLYDLWEETFHVEELTGSSSRTWLLNSKKEVLELLGSPQFDKVFSTSGLRSDKKLNVKAQVLLNPVGRQKMEEIQKWVQKNTVLNPINPTTGRAVRANPRRGDTIFNAIFEQFARGHSVASDWKASATSKPFQILELKNE